MSATAVYEPWSTKLIWPRIARLLIFGERRRSGAALCGFLIAFPNEIAVMTQGSVIDLSFRHAVGGWD